MTAAIATTVAKDKPSQGLDAARYDHPRRTGKIRGLRGAAAFEGTPVLVFTVKEADDTLAQMDGCPIPPSGVHNPQRAELSVGDQVHSVELFADRGRDASSIVPAQ